MADTLSAVLHDEPKPIAEINPRIPIAVAWIIEQCLAKDVAERYAATEDLARELRRVREQLRNRGGDGRCARRDPRSRVWQGVAGTAVGGRRGRDRVDGPRTSAAEPRLRSCRSRRPRRTRGVRLVAGWPEPRLGWRCRRRAAGVCAAHRRCRGYADHHGRFDAEEPFWAPDSRTIYFIARAGERKALWSVGGRGPVGIGARETSTSGNRSSGEEVARCGAGTIAARRSSCGGRTEGRTVARATAPFGDNGFGRWRPTALSTHGQRCSSGRSESAQRRARATTSSSRPRQISRVMEVLSGIANLANLRRCGSPTTGMSSSASQMQLGGNRAPVDRRHAVTSDASDDGRRIRMRLGPRRRPTAGESRMRPRKSTSIWPLFSRRAVTQRRALATARNEIDPAWSPDGDQFAFVTDRRGASRSGREAAMASGSRPIVTAADFGTR